MYFIVFFALFCSVFGFQDVSVVQYLRENGFNNLTEAIERTNLTGLLNTTGPFTIFAPTDKAFAKSGLVNFGVLTQVQLKAITEYTLVHEFILLPTVETVIVKTTLAGQNVTIEPVLGTLRLNNVSYVNSSNNDIIVNNGIVQPVDTLLSPPFWPTNPPQPALNIFQQILLHDDKYRDLALLIIITDMEYMFQSGEYTLFAPTDSAFAAHQNLLPDPNDPAAQQFYKELLKNHLVPGTRLSDELKDGQILYTLHNTQLLISVGTEIQVDFATVVDTDLMATNGVIHAIDDLLIPPDL